MRTSYFPIKIILLLISLFFMESIQAQKTYFLYIQTEAKIPFNLQLADKAYHSNATGYLLIPSLEAGQYTLVIDFPKNQFVSQTFVCEISEKDRGFRLKQNADNSWILYDLVTQAEIRNAIGKEAVKINYDNKLLKSNPDKAPTTTNNVTKTYQKIGANGINQAYTVQNGSKIDTVLLFIPAMDPSLTIPAPAIKAKRQTP
jgi:hypothetical protein